MFGYSSKEKEEVLEQPLELEQSRGSAARGELERYDAAEYGSTRRGLKSRHIQLIAIGGGTSIATPINYKHPSPSSKLTLFAAIGTGLFVGSGATLSLVGPAPFFMAFVVMSMIIWVVMNSLAEMTTWLPVSGTSVPFYVNRFLDPSMAFAAGWNYWYAYAILVAAEISAASIVIDYWTTKVPVAVWLAILLVLVLCLNVFVVSLYGEVEFWFASIKIIAIVGLIILGILLFPTRHHLSLYNRLTKHRYCDILWWRTYSPSFGLPLLDGPWRVRPLPVRRQHGPFSSLLDSARPLRLCLHPLTRTYYHCCWRERGSAT